MNIGRSTRRSFGAAIAIAFFPTVLFYVTLIDQWKHDGFIKRSAPITDGAVFFVLTENPDGTHTLYDISHDIGPDGTWCLPDDWRFSDVFALPSSTKLPMEPAPNQDQHAFHQGGYYYEDFERVSQDIVSVTISSWGGGGHRSTYRIDGRCAEPISARDRSGNGFALLFTILAAIVWPLVCFGFALLLVTLYCVSLTAVSRSLRSHRSPPS